MEQELIKSLSMYFVLALVFESGFNVLFSWRVFIKYLGNRGWKTPIMIVSAWLIFNAYDLDIISNIVKAFGHSQVSDVTFGGKLISALFIAGGSSGVNVVLNHLKIRENSFRKERVNQEVELKTWQDEQRETIEEKEHLVEELAAFEELLEETQLICKEYIEKRDTLTSEEEQFDVLSKEIQKIELFIEETKDKIEWKKQSILVIDSTIQRLELKIKSIVIEAN